MNTNKLKHLKKQFHKIRVEHNRAQVLLEQPHLNESCKLELLYLINSLNARKIIIIKQIEGLTRRSAGYVLNFGSNHAPNRRTFFRRESWVQT